MFLRIALLQMEKLRNEVPVMPKSRNRNKEIVNTLNKINENSEITAQNTQLTNEKYRIQ